MVRAEIIIGNKEGIHLIPANIIASEAEKFDSIIHLEKNHMDINAKSIIGLVSGAFRKGDIALCVCDGPDEKEALEAMKRILTKNFED